MELGCNLGRPDVEFNVLTLQHLEPLLCCHVHYTFISVYKIK